MNMISAAFTILAAAGFAAAQSTVPTAPANLTSLVYSEAQWNASGLGTPLPNSQSFNISLEAQALLGVAYNTTGFITNGQALTAAQVASRPQIVVYPGENATAFEAGASFTLILADASAIGTPDAEGDYRHFLANGVEVPANWTAEQLVFTPTTGNVITYYAGPGPLPNTGVHRYAWMLFAQPSNFTAPSGLSTSGVSPSHWSVNTYVRESGLGSLVAATYFTVAPEENNVSTIPISSINPATISVPSTTATGIPANNNNGGTNNGAASSSYAVSSAVLLAVAGAVAVLA